MPLGIENNIGIYNLYLTNLHSCEWFLNKKWLILCLYERLLVLYLKRV